MTESQKKQRKLYAAISAALKNSNQLIVTRLVCKNSFTDDLGTLLAKQRSKGTCAGTYQPLN